MKKHTPLVSVIIPTKNAGIHIRDCLMSIKRQTYPNIEIIVVDNHSTDNTVRIARHLADRIFIKGPERAKQVNYGIQRAHGKYVYYIGSDLTMEANLVQQAVEACEIRGADAVYQNVLTEISNPNIWQKVKILERQCYFKEPGMSGARFWRKRVFEKVGGLKGSLGDEIQFQRRLDKAGYKTVLINAKELNKEEYDSLKLIVRRNIYYGWLMGLEHKKFGEQSDPKYRLIRPEFLRHKDILLRDKRVFFFFILYKLIQSVYAGVGYTLARLIGYNRYIEKYLHKINYG